MKKIIAATLVTIAIVAVLFLYQSFQKPDVTIAEAGEKLAKQYGGTVKESEKTAGTFVYIVDVPKQGEYEMTVDNETGELLTMTRLQTEEAASEYEQQEAEAGNGSLTPEQAGEIALKKVSGTVDDIERGDEEEAGSYLVDINAENGEEATVRINAISGEIMSISWDD
jgi:uncharacterized membrane protein YkoI